MMIFDEDKCWNCLTNISAELSSLDRKKTSLFNNLSENWVEESFASGK